MTQHKSRGHRDASGKWGPHAGALGPAGNEVPQLWLLGMLSFSLFKLCVGRLIIRDYGSDFMVILRLTDFPEVGE